MFERLFKPKCPCDPAAKRWVEQRLAWLAGQLRKSAFSGGRIILPTREFFPDRYDGSEEAAHALFETVCLYMRVNPGAVRLKLVDHGDGGLGLANAAGEALGGTAGTWKVGGSGHVVTLDRSQLRDQMELVGTLAHELAHARLLGEGRVDPDVFDNELLTDLTTVHLGLGIFLANKPRDWMSGYTTWPGTTLKRPEYMNRPMYGWALAHLAYFRGEEAVPWTTHLDRFARLELEQGLRYLKETGDTSYRPPRPERPL